MSRLPPFGRLVKSALQNPEELQRYSGCNRTFGTVWIATGPAAWDWQEAHPKHLTLVLPVDESPAAYRFDFLRGHEPILIIGDACKGPVQRRAIAAALFRDGVQRVLAGNVLMVADARARAA